MTKNELTYKIRPAARLVHTIGSDLIGDSYAALVELVKNSYDADASNVDIQFDFVEIDNEPALKIKIIDDGHGMSFETVINKWLVPATNDKLKRKSSPKGRVFQGRKGIGRFAASILGQEMTIATIDPNGEKSTAVIDWRVFNTDEYLENIELLVEKEITKESSGTFIEIIAKDELIIDEEKAENEKELDYKLSYWTGAKIDALENELKKLISPLQEYESNDFKINLSFKNSPLEEYNNREFRIEPYPIIKLYDYRIYGNVDSSGNAKLVYENNVDEIVQKDIIETKYKLETEARYCGNVRIDFRVFDREPEAIDNLINKGLIDPVTKKYAGKNEAKRLLNEVYGVNIYRNNFRVRPYGNGGIDWLDLDKDRVQNFTLKVSNNQVVGFVTIESEENSNLKEKSARDGLKENEYYFGLKELCKKVLRELELRRLTYREKTLKSRKGRSSIKKDIDDLFSFKSLEDSVRAKLGVFQINDESINEITQIIKNEEVKKTLLLENIQKTIAVYQGHATLGKIVSFILHEGRKSIHYFKNESPVLRRYMSHFKATKDEDSYNDIIKGLEGFVKHSGMMAELFARINPLASQSRGNKVDFKVKDCIQDAEQIFKQSMKSDNIIFKYNCDSDILLYGWNNDLYMALANLIENSVYWLNLTENQKKEINIEVRKGENFVIIDYTDNGPGLSVEEIKSEMIFEPGYSKKIDGTGLGLAIAGEAIERLNGRLIALESDLGAYFQIEINTTK
ncbi:MAG: histidine kinase [Bacteroidetes bacterium GWC2_33_15]|nr:MAG: histidine kinase [Bacteroidetes bacterium GWA2_33_15]OFX50605.1 MAG: histidine kinase [Bacteroidetes bacterium GWC2_33_15]OFX64142.1 MAG: histidine kinase [Bacteroidetes bacterium GWB2_32_14]OFX69754.1 MAG: histidine kinase [Bacteroidetes bacterium GWD2_33_33]HAN19791.1 histidine kinase [Bacteroidales bacterium]